ncbi:hypothetical protein [Burkholderia lata]|uniref:hypothetical protein n=1 Tax=Burkholderia lata (strain ATCC 17760 / DSM 23089 / LMG 22485 / NCIMB 9086 / R18194 / 383) TaxID=482957 RepID=UPI001581AB1F|nr:hypothetical protein [Burkholderia lata]
MYLKDARMLIEWFEFPGGLAVFCIKINELRLFCAVGYTWRWPKRKTNEIANVCAAGTPFCSVMYVGALMDNVIAV